MLSVSPRDVCQPRGKKVHIRRFYPRGDTFQTADVGFLCLIFGEELLAELLALYSVGDSPLLEGARSGLH